MTSRARLIALISIFVVVVLIMLATGVYFVTRMSSTISGGGKGGSDTSVELDGTEEAFRSQPVNWKPCDANDISSELEDTPEDLSSYECATLKAPLDWDNVSDGKSIDLRIAVHRSGTDNAEPLFFNLGGPGGASVGSLSSQVTSSMGKDLVKNFDIVALDPRGVGASTPVQCMTDEERDRYNSTGAFLDQKKDIDRSDYDALIQATREESKALGENCRKLSGDIAQHIDTVSVARDFDMVRELLGQEKMNYLGYSYGTFLGATYADLFPDRVGRFVLDGAVDPSMSSSEIFELQMYGFEKSITHWIEDCQAGPDCPLPGDTEQGVKQLTAFLDNLEKAPLQTSDPNRPLTQQHALTAVIGLMYNPDNYVVLKQGLSQAMLQEDGSILLRVADFLADRKEDGTYAGNSTEAIIAINNLDFPPTGTPDEWKQQVEKMRKELTIMGPYVEFGDPALEEWPFTRTAERQPLKAEGAPEILVIGTTHDPATPYIMSENLAKQLSKGILIGWEGWGHTAYRDGGSICVQSAVEDFFLKGTLPNDGLMCTD